MSKKEKQVFFPNLNGIRFIAALMVIVEHLETSKRYFGLRSWYRTETNLGGLGVTLFFVLSGFLITYLLLSEKRDFNTISLREFYIRRILRIWPLYYLVIVIGFFIVPYFLPVLHVAEGYNSLWDSYYARLLLDLFFLPNVTLLCFSPMLFLSPIWSIGVEEQFYLMWPLFIKYTKNPLRALLAIIVLFILANFTIGQVLSEIYAKAGPGGALFDRLYFVKRFIGVTRIDCMAVGGIASWLLFNRKDKLLKVFYSRPVQVVAYVLTVALITNGTRFRVVNHLPYSVLFGIIILNLASNDRSILSINGKLFNYLGKISYGIYMYHELAIIISMLVVSRILGSEADGIYGNAVIYLSSVGIVVLMSALSYRFFEKFFLLKKVKFSRIVSGDNVVNA